MEAFDELTDESDEPVKDATEIAKLGDTLFGNNDGKFTREEFVKMMSKLFNVGGNRCSARVTSALSCGLRHQVRLKC